MIGLALALGFVLGCFHSLACWWLLKGGMNPTVIAVLGLAGPVVAVYAGWASA